MDTLLKEEINEVLKTCAAHWGCHVSEILGKSRERNILLARRDAARVLVKKGLSYEYTGKVLNRHRTTINNLLGVLGRNRKRGDRQIYLVGEK